MAEVFLARERRENGGFVVIKRLLPAMMANPDYRAMFVDEAELTANLSHPNIVDFIASGHHAGEHYLVMEYIDGASVASIMQMLTRRKRRVPAEVAVHLICEVLNALDFAHTRADERGQPMGIVHRDISPSNILLSRQGRVKLIDFGIALFSFRDHQTRVGLIKGKLSYMAPEQIIQGEVDARSDIFSAAVVLCELLLGRSLFHGHSELDVLLKVRDAQLDTLDRHGWHIAHELHESLRRALAKAPDKRFPSARDFRASLMQWLHSLSRVRTATQVLKPFADAILRAQQNLRQAYKNATRPGVRAKLNRTDTDATPRVTTGSPQRSLGLLSASATDPDESASSEDAEDVQDTLQFTTQDLLAGQFAQTPAIAVLHRLAARRANGRLDVTIGGVSKQIFFRDGLLQHVVSNVAEERLGSYLLRQRALSRSELDLALEMLPLGDARLGEVLVDLAVLSRLALLRHLSGQAGERIVDVCTWPKGKFSWQPDERAVMSESSLAVNLAGVLAEGALKMPEGVVATWLSRVNQQVPRVDEASSAHPIKRQLGGLGHQIHTDLDGVRTVGELAAYYGQVGDRERFVRVLFLFVHTGVASF